MYLKLISKAKQIHSDHICKIKSDNQIISLNCQNNFNFVVVVDDRFQIKPALMGTEAVLNPLDKYIGGNFLKR